MVMKFPNPNMLLYIGIGDAYGAGAEYLKFPRDDQQLIDILRFDKYYPHPAGDIPAGNYTDDTEMSVANALVLIENDPPYTLLMFANAWVREFARGGQRRGYSRKFQEFLERTKTGEEFLRNINPNSNKNGACMRAVPIGVLPKVEQVLEVATMQAAITHNTPEGFFSARAVALMSHYALYEASPFFPFFLAEYCLDNLPEEDIVRYADVFKTGWDGGPVRGYPDESVAITTVRAVLESIYRYSHLSLRAVLEQIIQWGGDTDSVAAIALGIASARVRGGTSCLPEFMFVNLEQSGPKTGAKYLLDIGTRLMEKFDRQKEDV